MSTGYVHVVIGIWWVREVSGGVLPGVIGSERMYGSSWRILQYFVRFNCSELSFLLSWNVHHWRCQLLHRGSSRIVRTILWGGLLHSVSAGDIHFFYRKLSLLGMSCW